jgi:hypothetical protein
MTAWWVDEWVSAIIYNSGPLEHFHYYCDVVRLAECGRSFTPARKDRAPGIPIR